MSKEDLIKEINEILIKIENVNLIEYFLGFISKAVTIWK